MAHLEYTANDEIARVVLDSQAITYLHGEGTRLTVAAPSEKTSTVFYHSKRYYVVLSLGGPPVFVNRCKVSLLKIVREGDQIAIGPHTATFRELVTEVVSRDAPNLSSSTKCLVCQRPFQAGDHVVYCPSCHAAHHDECWKWVRGRCANGKVCLYQAPWDDEASTA